MSNQKAFNNIFNNNVQPLAIQILEAIKDKNTKNKHLIRHNKELELIVKNFKKHNSNEQFNLILNGRDNLGRTALHIAAYSGHVLLAKRLSEDLTQAQQFQLWSSQDYGDYTPLHYAASEGKIYLLQETFFSQLEPTQINAVWEIRTTKNNIKAADLAQVGYNKLLWDSFNKFSVPTIQIPKPHNAVYDNLTKESRTVYEARNGLVTIMDGIPMGQSAGRESSIASVQSRSRCCSIM